MSHGIDETDLLFAFLVDHGDPPTLDLDVRIPIPCFCTRHQYLRHDVVTNYLTML